MKIKNLLISVFLTAAFIAAPTIVRAQIVGADNGPLFSRHNEDRPKSIKEGLEKMRIEKEQKDHDEMVSRGEDAVKLAADLQESFARSGHLSSEDISKASKLEKLIKKIRDDLGGDDDSGKDQNSDDDDPAPASDPVPNSLSGAVEALRSKTGELSDQLRQTTRFTISADAIQNTNTLLKIVKVIKTRQ